MKKCLLLLLCLFFMFTLDTAAANQQPEEFIPEEIQPLLQSWQNKGQKTAYLTFDDGPSLNTLPILDILDKYHVKATFFVMGNEEGYADGAYQEMAARGHTLALHTYSHNYEVVYGSRDKYFADMALLEKMLKKYGVHSRIVRFPGGSRNLAVQRSPKKEVLASIKSELKKRGYIYFDWDIDSTDGYSPSVSKQTIVSNVLNGTEDQEQIVILLHDINSMKNTVRALPDIITGLKAKGYQFDSINEYTEKVQFGESP